MCIEDDVKKRFSGYHVEISFWPSGGMIECSGCQECGSDDSRFESVLWKRKSGNSLEWAITRLEEKMMVKYGSDWIVKQSKDSLHRDSE